MNKEDKISPPGSCDWVPAEGREQATGLSCDWGGPAGAGESGSAFKARRPDFTWEGVTAERYKTEEGGWAAIARHVLVAGAAGAGFDLRYFEIAPGGHSSLERHQHAHVVVCVRGRGRVLLGGAVREMAFLDTIYLAPDDPHQLLNPFAEPFGFLCIVDHDRDRPRPVDEAELQRLLASEAGKEIKR